jgi:hypothetical protein
VKLEQRLFSKDLTERQRVILENKAEKLRKAIPAYIQLVKDEIFRDLKKDE